MNKKNWIWLILAVLVVVGGVLLYKNKNQKQEEDVIKIGAILPMTGNLSIMGQVEKNAMLLALEESKHLKIIFEDNQSDSKLSVTAAQKLIEIDKIDILLTSTTGASYATEPISSRYNKNHVAFCMDSEISSKSKNIIRYYFGINEEMDGIIKFVKNQDKTKRIGILYGNVAAWEEVISKNLMPFLSKGKYNLVFKETYDIKQNDFTNLSLKLKQSNVDYLILLGYGFEYEKIFNSFIKNDLLNRFQIIGGWGFLYTKLPKEQIEGIYVSGPQYVFDASDKNYSFKSKYYKRFNSYPNFDAAFAYEAIKQISNNYDVLKKEMNLKNYFKNKIIKSDVLGEYRFDSIGNLIIETELGIINNGNIRGINFNN